MRLLFLFASFLFGIQLSRYWHASEKSSDLLNYRYTNKVNSTLNMRLLFLFSFFLFGIQLSRYWNASKKSSDLLNYRYTNKVNSTLNILSTRVATSNRTLTRCNIRPRGIVDITTLLIMLSGDVNLNPGPCPPK